MPKSKTRTEFGDFQTPADLAQDVCDLLLKTGISPSSILEPTCGRGGFLLATAKVFTSVQKMLGVEINPHYSHDAEQVLKQSGTDVPFEIVTADFFSFPWDAFIRKLPQPLLIVGNPPWVTNAELGAIDSKNVPKKSNFQNHRGIDAITGKGNFDISEYMLLHAIEWLNDTSGTLAVLCKTAVARKVLIQAWKKQLRIKRANIYVIDAGKHFGAAVDAGLLVIQFDPSNTNSECHIHPNLNAPAESTFGMCNDRLVADIGTYTRRQHLEGGKRGTWRSGIKHDCAKVMQFTPEDSMYRNGLGELVDLEDEYLYPMLKSSDLANNVSPQPRYKMLVPQRFIGEQTKNIRHDAPHTWKYLVDHAGFLDQRLSSIYRNRPQFSIFGIGDYSFAPWKIAIAGLYKTLKFRLIGPSHGRPVVLDDTCYFYSCENKADAMLVLDLLNSSAAVEFLSSLIFWDEKRPVTANLLNRLDLFQLAKELGRLKDLQGRIAKTQDTQQVLF